MFKLRKKKKKKNLQHVKGKTSEYSGNIHTKCLDKYEQ